MSQVLSHGLDPNQAILQLSPREGEYTLREEDLFKTLEEQGSSIALVLFSGVQYYTGQWFPMESITRKAKEQVGSGHDFLFQFYFVPEMRALGLLLLHDQHVYLFFSGLSGLHLRLGSCACSWERTSSLARLERRFRCVVHLQISKLWAWWDSRNIFARKMGFHQAAQVGCVTVPHLKRSLPLNLIFSPTRFAGWWGHELATRFDMVSTFSPTPGAQGFQQSNPSILALASLLGSLEVLKEAGMMEVIRERSLQLTGAFLKLLKKSRYFVPTSEVLQRYGKLGCNDPGFTIITPTEPSSRGAQLSLVILPTGSGAMQKVFNTLVSYGVIGDERRPDVIRLAPIPLYNTLADCKNAAKFLDKAISLL